MESKTRIYYWIHHTGITQGNTGVQRTVRMLASGLASNEDVDLVPVRWCAAREAIVRADGEWLRGLARFDGPSLPEPSEPGEALHLATADADRLYGTWLLIPEVPHLPSPPDRPSAPLALALDYARYYRLRSALIFYDLIPLRFPGYEQMVPEHQRYAQALAGADLILSISNTSADDLKAWWREQVYDSDRLPAVRPVQLPAELPAVQRVTQMPADSNQDLRLVAWGTILPRKNQLELMRAFNRLLRRLGLDLRLDLVGDVDPSVADAVHAEVAASHERIRWHGYLSDAALATLIQDSDATAFVSLFEGFGLPIAESLWLGRPCLCSNIGSMAEIAEGGGCLTVDPYNSAEIEQALERLATDVELRRRLTAEAITRPLPTWTDFGAAVLSELRRLPLVARVSVIEGTKGGAGDLSDSLAAAGIAVRQLHWRADTQSVLPGFCTGGADAHGPGYGDLRRSWIVLPLKTVHDLAETMLIEDEVRARGAKLAVWVEPRRLINAALVTALAKTDLVLFPSTTEREAALAEALRVLERTTTVRRRYRVAGDAMGVIAAIFEERDRTVAVRFPRPITRIYYWCGTIATQKFNSGIQRATRLIATSLEALAVDVVPVKWDVLSGCLAMLNEEEAEILGLWSGPRPRRPEPLPADLTGEWMLVVEIPLPLQPPGSNPARLARDLGMRVAAVFYDLIAHKMQEIYPQEVLTAIAQYWAMFSEVDVVLPISWTAAGDLRRYMADRGLGLPALVPCPLAGDLPGVPRVRRTQPARKVVNGLCLLAVGTWEPRKNYVRLIRAVARARELAPDVPITLTIAGRQTGYGAMETEARLLADTIGGIELLGHVSDTELEELFRTCHATVYASWEEGFGLPVLESLWRGRPCLCHDGSAVAEVSCGGGTLPVNMLDEEAIARGIEALAVDEYLYTRLCEEALVRPIRSWEECAQDILLAMRRTAAVPGWPAPAVMTAGPRPLLTCAISTYNRAGWLSHSLERLIEATRPWRDSIGVVVCDNASTDRTPEVVARHLGTPGFTAKRNAVNVGMLGNLGMTARASKGTFIWILGDDDLIIDGAIEQVLTGLERHRDVEMAYMNYSYTRFDAPEQIADAAKVVREAIPIGYGGANRRVDELRQVAGLHENQFTAIYACAFRSDHALRAYQQDTRGVPFSSLLTCVPSAAYALAVLADRPAWWVGQPAVVVNMNVSWLRWALLWHLERMHDLFDASELAGVDPVRLDRYRFHHVHDAGNWTRMALFTAEDSIRERVSIDRFLERAKHIEAFRPQAPLVHAAYAEAWAAGRVLADKFPPDELFARHGLLEQVYAGAVGPGSRDRDALHFVAREEGYDRPLRELLASLLPDEATRQSVLNSTEAYSNLAQLILRYTQ
jgi:glycosyltransferase involved in cell wall biosynthesis